MKKLSMLLALILSTSIFANDISLVCNDQNSHAVHLLNISSDLKSAQLSPLVKDSSVLSAGTKNLKIQEGESSEEMTMFAGKMNNGLNLVLTFDSASVANLKTNDVLSVLVNFQPQKGDVLSGNTTLLCSIR